MPETADQLADKLRSLTEPGTRDQIVAKGLARGMIWRNGVLPSDAPFFSPSLTADLLDHGYGILAMALRLRDTHEHSSVVIDSCRVAAEAIEAAVRRGQSTNEERGYHLIAAAAAFHIAGFSARSYCLLVGDLAQLNLSSAEKLLKLLMERRLSELRKICFDWLNDPSHIDAGIVARLEEDTDFTEDEVLALSLTRNFHRAIALFDFALQAGKHTAYSDAVGLLRGGAGAASKANFVSLWWTHTLAYHLLDELWDQSLHMRMPLLSDSPDQDRWDELREKFIATLGARELAEIDLWPSQLLAAERSADMQDDLVIAMPTSAGKTRIAELCILRTLAANQRVVYVTPLRALSAQLEKKLASTFGPLGFSVSSLYGASGVTVADVDALESTQIVVATPEKLDFAIRQNPSIIYDVGLIVLDEGHMIGLGAREVRYEVLVQRLLSRSDANDRRIVCLSAVFSSGDAFEDFTKWLRSDDAGEAIETKWRPTRQRAGILVWMGNVGRLDLIVEGENPFVPRFIESELPQGRRKKSFPSDNTELVIATAKTLVADGQRVLIYCPQRSSVESIAAKCLKLHTQGYFPGYVQNEELVKRAIAIGEEWLGREHVAIKALELGVAVHHGGLPRQYLAEIESLLQKKVLPVVIASPTLAQGLDLSCSALIFHSIHRGGDLIKPEEYANVVGRAGRAFVDLDGLSIYSIFDNARRRIWLYQQLRRDAVQRQLESGILLLIRKIAENLAVALNCDINQLLEYVLGCENWIPENVEINEKKSLQELLGDLDATILSTIEDLDAPTEELANILDAVLQSSYWKRRIGHLSIQDQELQKTILAARAQWLWNRSDGQTRRAFFSAGVGYEVGIYIDNNIASLLERLYLSDMYIAAGNSEAAADQIVSLAEDLFSLYLFAPDHLPSRWRDILRGWIAGKPLEDLVSAEDASEIDFIQKGIVYLLVWAVEAVRVHAASKGISEADLLTGATPLTLTYGAPSVPCALLLQAGLPSRSMAMTLMEILPPDFSDREGLVEWVNTVRNGVDLMGIWENTEKAVIWSDFQRSIKEYSDRKWLQTESVLNAVWIEGAPEVGSFVRLLDDPARNVTHICTSDLILIGHLQNRFMAISKGNVVAYVSDDLNVLCHRFGPSVV